MSEEEAEQARRLFSEKIVHNCAPTLAALKPAGLFTVHFAEARSCSACEEERCNRLCRAGLAHALHAAREQLEQAGVEVRILALRPGNALVLVYRPSLVDRVLANARTAAYLRGLRYDTTSQRNCIDEVARRIRACDKAEGTKHSAFPHEIGFLLGYPHDDVVAFIEGGQDCLCTGCWKVFGDECSAQTCFDTYRRCVRKMDTMHAAGMSLAALAHPIPIAS